MKRHLLLILLSSALFLASPVTLCEAADRIVLTDDVQLKLADAFMSQGEYYRAVTEYKKFLILFPGSPNGDYALFNMGMAYFRGEEYKHAVDVFASVGQKYGKSNSAAGAGYYEGLSYVKLNTPNMAGKAFDRVVALYPSSGYAPTAIIGKSLLLFDEQDITGSRNVLEQFLASYPNNTRVENVREAISLLDQMGELPRKSPFLAGAMSAVIPGSGQIYSGHYGDGITAFILNGLFIAGTVVAIEQENCAVAGIVGVIGLPFYAGNIYGAANAATKWNLGVRRDLRGKIAVILDYHF
jgi:outer membrane protein assembly factor BamD (BamD/ComL family)/TM2 domain-containing membrane protein YozV